MLLFKHLMLTAATAMFTFAAAIVAHDIYLAERYQRLLARGLAETLLLPTPSVGLRPGSSPPGPGCLCCWALPSL